MQVWVDGRLVDAADAHVSVLDAGWRLGDGVFSTLRCLDGRPQRLTAHVARTVADAAAIGIVGVDAEPLAAAAEQVAAANADAHDDLVLRLVVTRGTVAVNAPFGTVPSVPTVAVLASPAPADTGPVTATLIVGGRRPAAVKSTSWAWSRQAIATARAAGADTALLVEDGRVLEGAAANVVVRLGDRLLTPRTDGRLLPGTTRALLLDELDGLEEVEVTTDQLVAADEVVLTSAVRGAVAVVTVDGDPVGTGAPGRAATRVRSLLSGRVGPRPPEH